MKVKVTKNHIRRGVSGDSNMCPIALAVREAVGAEIKKKVGRFKFPFARSEALVVTLDDVDVNGDDVTVDYRVEGTSDGDSVLVRLNQSCTKKMSRFVENFDNRRSSAKPFEFNLKLAA